MESQSSTTWAEGKASLPHSRQYEAKTQKGRNSMVVRKMDSGDAPGVVVRELWLAGEPKPQDFFTDAEFIAAVQAAGLPAIDIEPVRRSVAATMLLN